MAHENKVIRSVNLSGEMNCVDLFQRPDGSFGFEEYRRDPEDAGRGWYCIGYFGEARFATADAAWDHARAEVAWLASEISGST